MAKYDCLKIKAGKLKLRHRKIVIKHKMDEKKKSIPPFHHSTIPIPLIPDTHFTCTTHLKSLEDSSLLAAESPRLQTHLTWLDNNQIWIPLFEEFFWKSSPVFYITYIVAYSHNMNDTDVYKPGSIMLRCLSTSPKYSRRR